MIFSGRGQCPEFPSVLCSLHCCLGNTKGIQPMEKVIFGTDGGRKLKNIQATQVHLENGWQNTL